MPRSVDLAHRIVDTAVTLAEGRSWEAIRLHEVAEALGITLDDVRRHYREKDALIDAWFDRADASMLAATANPAFRQRPPRERFEQALLLWLQALQPRRVTREMILSKCEPGHLHIQIPAVMRISRTVQWLREAAQYHDTFLRRALAETAHTAIYLTTFIYWLNDDSAGARRTHRLLHTLLHRPAGRGQTVWTAPDSTPAHGAAAAAPAPEIDE